MELEWQWNRHGIKQLSVQGGYELFERTDLQPNRKCFNKVDICLKRTFFAPMVAALTDSTNPLKPIYG